MEQKNTESLEQAADISDKLFPAPNEVKLEDGRVVTVSRVKMKHNGAVLRLVIKLVDELGLDTDGNLTINTGDMVAMLRLIAKFPDDINEVCALLSDLTLEEVGELDDADGYMVVKKIIEVNRDFFTNKVAPMFRGAVQAKEAASRLKRTRKS